MLALGLPKISFQHETSSAHQRLHDAIKKQLPEEDDQEKVKKKQPAQDNDQLAFQVTPFPQPFLSIRDICSSTAPPNTFWSYQILVFVR